MQPQPQALGQVVLHLAAGGLAPAEGEAAPEDEGPAPERLGAGQGLSGEDFDRWLLAFCKRKWNCAFSEEMTRSAAQMIAEWREGK